MDGIFAAAESPQSSKNFGPRYEPPGKFAFEAASIIGLAPAFAD
jgi:hypothetical protein